MIRNDVHRAVQQAFDAVVKDLGLVLPDGFVCALERPQEESHGEFSTNAAMVVSKMNKKNPRIVADALVQKLKELTATTHLLERVEVAGPGFVNMSVAAPIYAQELKSILALKSRYGRSLLGHGQKARIEFVSANPTGPLHVGHGRGAVTGDVLSSLYEWAGYTVVREYYLNDCGNQMNILGKTTLAWMDALQKGEEPAFLQEEPDGSWYRGDYMREVAQFFLAKGLATTELQDTFEMGRRAGDVILEWIKQDLKDFGVAPFDLWSSEKTLHDSGKVQQALDLIKTKGLIEEKDGAVWFLSSRLGDDKDRVVIKSDGALTYLAADIAFHHQKFAEGYDRVIDIWGADHHGYIARVRGAIEAMGHDPKKFSVILCQLVRLMRDEVVVPMSTRAGEFIPLKDIVQEVGKDVARYFFLMRKADAHLDFDVEAAKKQSMDNPVYYIQYAYARICSVERQWLSGGLTERLVTDIVFQRLESAEERHLMKMLSQFQETVEGCVLHNEPHRLSVYMQELASAFHTFYRQCRVIGEDAQLNDARYALIQAAKVVLQNGLNILGLSAPREM